MAVAQARLETGGRLVNWNFANIGAAPGEPYTVTGGAHHAAYANAMTGARSCWHMLVTRCSMALTLFDTGLVELVAVSLRRCGFYRVSVDQYAAGLRSLAAL